MRLLKLITCLVGFMTLFSTAARADHMADCENIIRAGNESWAYRYCLLPAEEGNPKAQVLIGMAFMTGVGINKNPEMAVYWFKRAADQNYPGGMYQLALSKLAGLGTPEDEKGGMALMQKSAQAGSQRAADFLTELGVPVEKPAEPAAKTRKQKKYECTGIGCGRPTDGFGR